jgi:Uma2 family endonuclease
MTTTASNNTARNRTHSYNEALLSILPRQGEWSVAEYLWLTNTTNRLIEYTDGQIEVLAMPTRKHQAILQAIFLALHAFIRVRGGAVYLAAFRLQIAPEKFREPDLLLLCDKTDPRNQNAFWTGADLVVEVVSPDDSNRDLITKRAEYAQAGVTEYWILNPATATITVLTLKGNNYTEHGIFRQGTIATSALLPEFSITVDEVLEAD